MWAGPNGRVRCAVVAFADRTQNDFSGFRSLRIARSNLTYACRKVAVQQLGKIRVELAIVFGHIRRQSGEDREMQSAYSVAGTGNNLRTTSSLRAKSLSSWIASKTLSSPGITCLLKG